MDGIRCLQEISKQDKPIGCREMARMMNLDPARVNRLLMTLEEEGILIKNSKKNTWRALVFMFYRHNVYNIPH